MKLPMWIQDCKTSCEWILNTILYFPKEIPLETKYKEVFKAIQYLQQKLEKRY